MTRAALRVRLDVVKSSEDPRTTPFSPLARIDFETATQARNVLDRLRSLAYVPRHCSFLGLDEESQEWVDISASSASLFSSDVKIRAVEAPEGEDSLAYACARAVSNISARFVADILDPMRDVWLHFLPHQKSSTPAPLPTPPAMPAIVLISDNSNNHPFSLSNVQLRSNTQGQEHGVVHGAEGQPRRRSGELKPYLARSAVSEPANCHPFFVEHR
jgi:hypothetical protein